MTVEDIADTLARLPEMHQKFKYFDDSKDQIVRVLDASLRPGFSLKNIITLFRTCNYILDNLLAIRMAEAVRNYRKHEKNLRNARAN